MYLIWGLGSGVSSGAGVGTLIRLVVTRPAGSLTVTFGCF
jgi:hypothetical protein